MKTRLILFSIFLSVIWNVNGQWSYSTLTAERARLTAAVLGSKAYFAGGEDINFDQVSEVQIYDTELEDWDTIINLSVPRSHAACAVAGNKIFFAGGTNINIPLMFDDIDVWNTETNQWEPEINLVFPRVTYALSYGSKVLFAGGIDFAMGIVHDIVEVYDVETEEWSFAQLSLARAAFAYAIVGDLAIFAGGFTFSPLNPITDQVDIYNFTTDTWSTAKLSTPRGFLAAATVGSKVLIAGGVNPDNTLSKRVDIYDAATNSWSIDSLSGPRAMFQDDATTICGELAYFAGGGTFDLTQLGWTQNSDVIDIYNNVDGTWTVDYLPEAVNQHTVAGVGEYFIAAGGFGEEMNPISTVGIYHCLWCGGDEESAVVSQQSSVSVHPNPTSGIMNCQLSIVNCQKISLKLYDIQGREVALIFDGVLTAGEHTITFDISGQLAGIYFYRLTATGQQGTANGKIIKL
jgi:N-acetylneuraminic acid mutarotase